MGMHPPPLLSDAVIVPCQQQPLFGGGRIPHTPGKDDQPVQCQQKNGGVQQYIGAGEKIIKPGDVAPLEKIPEHHLIQPYRNKDETDDPHTLLRGQLLIQHLVERLLVGVQLRRGGIVTAVDVQIRCQVTDVFPAHLGIGGDTLLLSGIAPVALYVNTVAHGLWCVLPEAHGTQAELQQEKPAARLLVQPALNGVDLVHIVGKRFLQHKRSPFLAHRANTSNASSRLSSRSQSISQISLPFCSSSVWLPHMALSALYQACAQPGTVISRSS